MVFINSSEASQANSQFLSIAQDTIQAIALLLKTLLDKKEQLLEKSPDNPSPEISDPTPTTSAPVVDQLGSEIVLSPRDYIAVDFNDPSPNSGTGMSPDEFRQQVMAGVAVALVDKFGVDGTYQAEDYLIQNDEALDGEIIYEIFDQDDKLISAFIYEPEGNPPATFFLDVSTIDAQIQFVETAYKTANVDVADLATDLVGYLAVVDALGDLAPAGSRGVILVESALDVNGNDDFKGNNYTFVRDSKGDVTITDNQTNSPILQTKNGQISSQSLSSEDLAKFKQVFNKMQESLSSKEAAPLKASKSEVER